MILTNIKLKLLAAVLLMGLPVFQAIAKDLFFEPGFFITKSIIGSHLGSDSVNASGLVNINIASGEANKQTNNGDFSLNLQGGAAEVVATDIQQIGEFEQLLLPDMTEAQIIGNSFVNTLGWIAINQVSGQNNVQANAFVFSEQGAVDLQTSESSASGINDTLSEQFSQSQSENGFEGNTELGIIEEALADKALQETLTGEQPLIDGEPVQITHKVSVEDTVFRGTLGLIQLNQSAGSGNNSTNHFALRVNVDAKL